MANILFTLAEEPEKTSENHFAVRFGVDENDCFAFSDALQKLGHDVYFVNWNDLSGEAFTRMFHDNSKAFVTPPALTDFNLAFIYKMEGFYFDMPRFFKMVSLFERKIKRVVNDPKTIRHNIDKHYLFELEKAGMRVAVPRLLGEKLESELALGNKYVVKPRYGERGREVTLVNEPGDLIRFRGKEDQYIAQKYMPGIRDGEKSLVFLGYDYQHAVIKTPNRKDATEFRCNESLGGTVAVYEPTSAEVAYCLALLETYAGFGCPVHFSRVDFVSAPDGPTLIELELLNPSIFANYSNKGEVFGASFASYFDQLVG